MNYHRVMLQVATVAALVARWHNCPFDSATIERIGRAEEFLFQMLDERTGKSPQYGNNDGAWVLPLSECDFNDMRPAVQAAHYLVTGRRRLSAGTWDEDLLWLFGPEALATQEESSMPQTSSAFRAGGYYTLRGDGSWGMIRCHEYRDRPGHYDPLHFDLWWRGQNVLHDAGTYQYFPAEGRACEDYFQLSRSHNVVEIDGVSPVERVSRFLYFPWPKAHVRRFETNSTVPYFEGECLDYQRKPWQVLWRRAIAMLHADVWLIVDDLLGDGSHTSVLRWHLPNAPAELDVERNQVSMHTDAGDCHLTLPQYDDERAGRISLVRGQTDSEGLQGFASPYYGTKDPVPCVEIERSCRLPLRLVTIFASETAATCQFDVQSGQTHAAELKWKNLSWRITLNPPTRDAARIVIDASSLTATRGELSALERINR
jgi:asparagine synthase (glutamine-hydrolysing)